MAPWGSAAGITILEWKWYQDIFFFFLPTKGLFIRKFLISTLSVLTIFSLFMRKMEEYIMKEREEQILQPL